MNHYERLGVSSTATRDEIQQAYLRLVRVHHPDRGGDAATFAAVKLARDLLVDDAKRAAYDRQLAAPEPAAPLAAPVRQAAAAFRVADPRKLSVNEAEAVCDEMLAAAPPGLRTFAAPLLEGLLALKRRRHERGR
ncbi:DnaJ domain-containing protein [Nannocystis sp. ILAH1]|uniref:J domain-containing protein n=1 Tax=Nannocystis sp. ILAH1 TaxID=2996789 RepID=UPI00226D8765|nr:DnaJ domain-containing protein [Nannocystis sp. ILAH1]MCY0994339.1 DnaJ domain-containing protein [Nannocystis sp. ILAH1]